MKPIIARAHRAFSSILRRRCRPAGVALRGLFLTTFLTSPLHAEKPLRDYSHIRGVNHRMTANLETLKKELSYAQRLHLNSTRIWLSIDDFERDREGYVHRLREYIRLGHSLGISTMPILWNGNYLNPKTLDESMRPRANDYVKAMVEGVKNEPGLLMWDVMNEPYTNDFHEKAPASEKAQRKEQITAFIREQLQYVRSLDSQNALTVGYALAWDLEKTADLVDVLCFHDYSPLRSSVEEAYRVAKEISQKTGKPMLNSETGCPGRANPYDMVLEIAEKHRTGWYLFHLMIDGYWGEIHGLFYADGTIRDPSSIAAIMGFYRNRKVDAVIKADPNREGEAERALRRIEAALKDKQDPFFHEKKSTEELLDAAEVAANLLESAEMVPMRVPPTAKIQSWRAQPADARDREAIRAFVYELGRLLKEQCMIY
ncbi:MAG: hypothetical protein EAZ81_04320 [Verrucomicrobia bacterium]|nr:MAG: hypothetical protein EAZ81_04320 [Verrucomicrobiota bacterium]